MRVSRKSILWVIVGAAGVLHAGTGPASAQEILLKVDDLPLAGPCDPLLIPACNTRVQLGFEGGEIGAVTYFVDPALFPLRIKRVQILWGYDSPNCPPPSNNLQDAILVYAGAFGSLVLRHESDPIELTAGFINEFDLSAADIIINDGGISSAITVGMRFDIAGAPTINGVPNPCAASLMTDGDGCMSPISSLVKSVGGPFGAGWIMPCTFGMSGDFVIRTVVESIGQSCYADCDGSGTLDIFDFLCFQNSFVAGEPYACDCDPDPLCDDFDFLCFQNAFVAGCP